MRKPLNYESIVSYVKYTTKFLSSFLKALILEIAWILKKKSELQVENLFFTKPVAEWGKFFN